MACGLFEVADGWIRWSRAAIFGITLTREMIIDLLVFVNTLRSPAHSYISYLQKDRHFLGRQLV
jgi:hypothetical protein